MRERLAGYRLLRFDITASSAEQRALLDRYRLFGPPALQLFAADGTERLDLRIVGETDASALASALERAAAAR